MHQLIMKVSETEWEVDDILLGTLAWAVWRCYCGCRSGGWISCRPGKDSAEDWRSLDWTPTPGTHKLDLLAHLAFPSLSSSASFHTGALFLNRYVYLHAVPLLTFHQGECSVSQPWTKLSAVLLCRHLMHLVNKGSPIIRQRREWQGNSYCTVLPNSRATKGGVNGSLNKLLHHWLYIYFTGQQSELSKSFQVKQRKKINDQVLSDFINELTCHRGQESGDGVLIPDMVTSWPWLKTPGEEVSDICERVFDLILNRCSCLDERV